MKKIKPYYELLISIIWIAFYNIVLANGYERIEFRIYFFLALIIGLTLNLKNNDNKSQNIFKSIPIYIMISLVYDWYTFINNEIISPHSFFNLFISGHFSFDRIIDFSNKYVLSFKPILLVIHLLAIGLIVLLSNLDLKKLNSKIDLNNLLKIDLRFGSLIFLTAIVVKSFVEIVFSNIMYKSFYENLSEITQTNLPQPTGISFWMILTMLLFSLIQVYALYLLCKNHRIKNSKVFLIYFPSLFLYQFLFSIITGDNFVYARLSYFDTSLFIVLEVILLSVFILKYNSIVGFLISIILIWGFKIIFQFFIFTPDSVLEYFMVDIKNIYIPIITGLIAGTAYLFMNKVIKSSNYAS